MNRYVEIWKPISEYELKYEISNFGVIRKLSGDILKSWLDKGYPFVNLCKDGYAKKFHIHRLVAQAFIPNPENKPQVNHKDFNTENNHISNLEWCTHDENMRWSRINGRWPSGDKHHLYSGKKKLFYLDSTSKVIINGNSY